MTSDRSSEQGFTLIEILVVMLIIGILAAIALPAFLGQRSKAQDSKAKSDARNLVSQMEVCFRNTEGYVGCTAQVTAAETGLPIGPGAGEVRVTAENQTTYQIQATSVSDLGGAQHVFTITQNIGGASSKDLHGRRRGRLPRRW
ncbi:MAG: prepilin-type N-terminal cleavage/methylation domain-containing protein [Solirubrobacteraceae bacterium]